MTPLMKALDKSCKSNDIQLRPNASNGIWLSALLFLSYLMTILRSPVTATLHYEISTILLFGMFLQSIEVFVSFAYEEISVGTKLGLRNIPPFATSVMLSALLKQDILFSCFTGFLVIIIYRLSYLHLMRSLPFSFTLGEASVVTQAIIIFIYNCFLTLPFLDSLKQDITFVLQIGLLGVTILTLTTHFIAIFRKWIMFYALLVLVVVAVCVFPLRNKLAVTVLIEFIFNDLERIAIVGVYIALLSLAGLAVAWQKQKNQKVTTSIRKVFHILIVMVFLPGLIFQCKFLFVASVVILAIFIVLETARVIKLYPVADVLQSSVSAFIDEKDAGKVALTPIYLLVGCSAPLWIHNSPCDLTGSSSFELLPLLAGVLSIGIGDTFASIVGSKIGRHKWLDNKKSVEGTIASILAQGAFIYAISSLGYLPLSTRLAAVTGIAVIANGLIEALTDQVDNLVLPLVTYIILAFN